MPSLGRCLAIARRAVAVLEAPLAAFAVRPPEIGQPPATRKVACAVVLLDAGVALTQTDRRRPRMRPPPASAALLSRTDPIGLASIFTVLVYVRPRAPPTLQISPSPRSAPLV